jgi:tryptophan synthase alpha chain
MAAVGDYLKKLRKLGLRNPLLVGFGIRDKASFEAACEHANGAIIGSAFIKALEDAQDEELSVKQFLKSVI